MKLVVEKTAERRSETRAFQVSFAFHVSRARFMCIKYTHQEDSESSLLHWLLEFPGSNSYIGESQFSVSQFGRWNEKTKIIWYFQEETENVFIFQYLSEFLSFFSFFFIIFLKQTIVGRHLFFPRIRSWISSGKITFLINICWCKYVYLNCV